MSHKDDLRVQRTGTVINNNSKPMETAVMTAVHNVMDYIESKFHVRLDHETDLYLKDVVAVLREIYPDVKFSYLFDKSSMRSDGGVTSIVSKDGKKYPILIAEVKNQGTNDARAKEGKPKQAKGNAIERLGKNVIGFRTALLHEGIFPFVCFGDGCDFVPSSSILDRVLTISMFGDLNVTRVHNEGPGGVFNRGSFYFREAKWTEGEMEAVLKDVAEKSVGVAGGNERSECPPLMNEYFSKYGESSFV